MPRGGDIDEIDEEILGGAYNWESGIVRLKTNKVKKPIWCQAQPNIFSICPSLFELNTLSCSLASLLRFLLPSRLTSAA